MEQCRPWKNKLTPRIKQKWIGCPPSKNSLKINLLLIQQCVLFDLVYLITALQFTYVFTIYIKRKKIIVESE